ncbi:MAG: hypothetical protein OSJ72_01415 [Lachnospiraceae bacterium]|nr:hypothetical protein [Lachnospiraceae bacterium]
MICDKLYECCLDEKHICAYKKKCVVYQDSRTNAACEEKGKRYNLVNDKRFTITLFHVDGGMIFGEPDVKKCDFLYIVDDLEKPTAIFVELKGKDIYQAIRQVKETIDRYGTTLQRRIYARIVCNAVPRLYNDPSISKLRKELMKRYNGNLNISEKNKDEKYSEL